MTAPLLELRGLVKEYAATRGLLLGRTTQLRAVDGVSLMVGRGEALGLVGESGSGKTTLGRLVLRLLEPTAGSIRFDGVDLLALGREPLRRMRRRMQIVFQIGRAHV